MVLKNFTEENKGTKFPISSEVQSDIIKRYKQSIKI
jgi:hypothetical protein